MPHPRNPRMRFRARRAREHQRDTGMHIRRDSPHARECTPECNTS